MKKQLTKVQKRVLITIRENYQPPTAEKVAKILKKSRATVTEQFEILRRKGYLEGNTPVNEEFELDCDGTHFNQRC